MVCENLDKSGAPLVLRDYCIEKRVRIDDLTTRTKRKRKKEKKKEESERERERKR